MSKSDSFDISLVVYIFIYLSTNTFDDQCKYFDAACYDVLGLLRCDHKNTASIYVIYCGIVLLCDLFKWNLSETPKRKNNIPSSIDNDDPHPIKTGVPN